MPELCNGLCSELKYQFFLDTLTALATLLMAATAVGAANTWRKQKRSDIAMEIHDFCLAAALSLVQASDEIHASYNRDRPNEDFLQISARFEVILQRFTQKEKYALYAKHILKSDEIAKVVVGTCFALTDVQIVLAALKSQSFIGKSHIQRDSTNIPVLPMHKETEEIIEHLHKNWSQAGEGRRDLNSCINALPNYF